LLVGCNLEGGVRVVFEVTVYIMSNNNQCSYIRLYNRTTLDFTRPCRRQIERWFC